MLAALAVLFFLTARFVLLAALALLAAYAELALGSVLGFVNLLRVLTRVLPCISSVI